MMGTKTLNPDRERFLTQERLGSWNELIREAQLPADVAGVVSCGRAELLPTAARAMSKEEVAMLLNLIGIYMDTNRALQKHSQVLKTEIEDMRGALRGVGNKVERFLAIANFRDPYEHEDEED